jgi:hypothetical protein
MPQLAQFERFEVKPNMQLWTNLNFRRPEDAVLVASAGETIDTDDEDAFNAYQACPELTHTGQTP